MPFNEYDFPSNLEERDYRLFPAELEDNENVAFHGTDLENLLSITQNGFRPGPNLSSVSFAKESSGALYFWCLKRTTDAEGVILAVRFESLSRNGLLVESSIIHDYTVEPQPEIIGFVRVPRHYQHR
ncbi:hypothetical protein [Sinorhizobium fredii]|uniref:hypothetical protein n=1 Tax=Rhizobium fredii TaxID=380 RepID=UPI003516BD41